MKQFNVKKGPFIKIDNDTKKMMYHLIISLIPFFLFSLYKNGLIPLLKGYGSFYDLFRLILIIIIPFVVSLLTEYLYYIVIKKKKYIKKKERKK